MIADACSKYCCALRSISSPEQHRPLDRAARRVADARRVVADDEHADVALASGRRPCAASRNAVAEGDVGRRRRRCRASRAAGGRGRASPRDRLPAARGRRSSSAPRDPSKPTLRAVQSPRSGLGKRFSRGETTPTENPQAPPARASPRARSRRHRVVRVRSRDRDRGRAAEARPCALPARQEQLHLHRRTAACSPCSAATRPGSS